MSYHSPEHPKVRSSKLASSLPNQDHPGSGAIEDAFGPNSSIFNETTERLTSIYQQANHVPSVAARFREWQRFRRLTSLELTTDESSFTNQTYLALLARITARCFVAPASPIFDNEELLEIVNSDYFTRRGISNFGEGDIFSWLLSESIWELNLGELVLETIQNLADAAERYNFNDAYPGALDSIFQQLAPARQTIPRWLAEYIVKHELGLADQSNLSLLDTACGTGAFLCAAIETMAHDIASSDGDPMDTIFKAPDQIRGMDSDPLSVALARFNYLLAFGKLVQQDHPSFLIPIYLANGHIDNSNAAIQKPLSTDVGTFPLPEPVIENPLMLDWLLGRITNYMDGAQLRLHVQPEEVAIQEVLNAYYNYLTAPKPRTPIPEALTSEQADTLLETARNLIQLHIQGEGTLWLHLVQNMAAPMIFAKRGFDRITGLSSSTDLDFVTNYYLSPDGHAAIINSLEKALSATDCRLVDLVNVLPDQALLVTPGEGSVRIELAAENIPDSKPWNEAKKDIRIVE